MDGSGVPVGLDAVADSAHLAIVASSRGRGWTGIHAEEVTHEAEEFGLPSIPDHLLVFHLDRPLQIEERLAGRTGRLREGSLTILPAGAETQWQLQREAVRHLHLYLDAKLLAGVAADVGLNPDRVEVAPAIGVHDPWFEHIGAGFLSEIRSGGLGGRVYAESLATLLVVQLLRAQASVGLAAAERRSCLSQAALARITDYIEAHLGDDLTLAGLASEVGLSAYHFARLFRESTGLSPHQYIIRRRVERATRLLTESDASISAIAAAVGFASGSHLATHVRRLTGASPRDLR